MYFHHLENAIHKEEIVLLNTETSLTCFQSEIFLYCGSLFQVKVGQGAEVSVCPFCCGRKGYVHPGRRLAVKRLCLDVIANCIGTGLWLAFTKVVVTESSLLLVAKVLMNMSLVFTENIRSNFIIAQVRFNSIRNTLSLHEVSVSLP